MNDTTFDFDTWNSRISTTYDDLNQSFIHLTDTLTMVSDSEEATPPPPANPPREIDLAKLQSSIPPFYALNVRLWLKQVDAHFDIHGLKSDKNKFNLLHVKLQPEVLTQVADLIENPPATHMYEALKERLISAFSDSEQKRLKTLLSGIDLGDRKPSALFNEMRQISGTMLPDEVLKNVWMSKLPETVRGHVAANTTKKSVTDLIELADLVMDVSTASSSVFAVQKFDPSSDRMSRLEATVEKLTEAIANLTSQTRGRSHQRKRQSSSSSRKRNESKSSARINENGHCYYHAKFGTAARKCSDGCQYPKN